MELRLSTDSYKAGTDSDIIFEEKPPTHPKWTAAHRVRITIESAEP